MGEKIKLEIVTTTKIQATVKGKKRTIRMWRLPVVIPYAIKKHIKTYFKDAKNEALCESRTSDEWVDFIKSFVMTTEMRAWVTSIIWWHYGGEGTTSLYEYYRSFIVVENELNHNKKGLIAQLDKMGISKVANELASEREERRDIKLKKIAQCYEKELQ